MRFNLKVWRLRDVLFFLATTIVVGLYVISAGGGFPLDDSWIHQTYARNLAYTGQWAFMPGLPSAASTSPLYTVLLAVGYKIGVPYVFWTHFLGVAALASTAMLGARMAERLLPHRQYVGLMTGFALILTWHLIWAAASGMETMLFGMFTLALMWLSWRELDPRSRKSQHILLRGGLFGVISSLTVLTRPEGILLAGLISLMMVVGRPQSSWQGVIRWAVGAAVAFVIVISPYLLLNLRLTGGLLPNTAAAKQAEYAPLLQLSYFNRLMKMTIPIIAGGQVLLIPALGYFLWSIRRYNRQALFFTVPLLWAVELIALYAARLPADYQHGRYVIPALPSLVLLGAVGLVDMVVHAQSNLMARVLSRTLALSTLLAFLFFAFNLGLSQYRVDVAIIEEEMVAAAQWIARNVPTDELLAVHDIGAVGYFAPRPILDLAGLVSPEVIPLFYQPERLWDLLRLRDVRYLMAFPDQIPGGGASDSRLCLVFVTNGTASLRAGGANMAVYHLVWDGSCIQD
jgi:hypothetical protein